jgi:hypothetical protein
MTMPAGTYYVGDLCYVMHERWDEFCDVTISGTHVLSGEMELKDGTRFACYSTKWGDGSYLDDDHREYSVDAGLIGCVRMEDLELDVDGNSTRGGQVIEFKEPFETSSEDGKIYFGDICIDTDPSFDEYEEEEEDF